MALQAFKPAGDNYSCRDNVDKALIVRINETKEGIKTQYTAEATKWDNETKTQVPDLHVREHGGRGVVVDLVEISTAKPRIYKDVLWMTGAVVDRLWNQDKGVPFTMKLAKAPGKKYLVPTPLNDEEMAAAEAFETAHGENFFDTGLKASAARKKAAVPAQSPAPAAESFDGDFDDEDED